MKKAFIQTLNSFKTSIPMIMGVLMLVSLAVTVVPASFYKKIFTGNNIIDPLLGAVAGSISSGTPLVSYMVGGELLQKGVSLVAVTAFILTWVTVGIVQLPAEIAMLGKRFAIMRNAISFVVALIISVLTVITLDII